MVAQLQILSPPLAASNNGQFHGQNGQQGQPRLSVIPKVEGLVQVFTAAHRNFFVSVMAQSLRIAGQGTPVLVVQFLKGGVAQGYDRPTHLGQHLTWVRCDLPYCISEFRRGEVEKAAVRDLWQQTQTAMMGEEYELLVLDELSLAIEWQFITEAEVLSFLSKRPRYVEVILTGPKMPEALLRRAEQVTELRYTYSLDQT